MNFALDPLAIQPRVSGTSRARKGFSVKRILPGAVAAPFHTRRPAGRRTHLARRRDGPRAGVTSRTRATLRGRERNTTIIIMIMYYATGVSTCVPYIRIYVYIPIHVYNSNNNNIIIIPVAAGRDIRCAQVSARGPVAGSPGPSGRPGHRSSDGRRGHTAGRFRTGPLRRPGPELRAPVHTASRPCELGARYFDPSPAVVMAAAAAAAVEGK